MDDNPEAVIFLSSNLAKCTYFDLLSLLKTLDIEQGCNLFLNPHYHNKIIYNRCCNHYRKLYEIKNNNIANKYKQQKQDYLNSCLCMNELSNQASVIHCT